jgi:hypothetical protein
VNAALQAGTRIVLAHCAFTGFLSDSEHYSVRLTGEAEEMRILCFKVRFRHAL